MRIKGIGFLMNIIIPLTITGLYIIISKEKDSNKLMHNSISICLWSCIGYMIIILMYWYFIL